MMSITENTLSASSRGEQDVEFAWPMYDMPVTLLGEAGRWFTLEREGDAVIVCPKGPLPRRCTIRPAALFQQDRGFSEANTVMGRLVFPKGAAQHQRYRPFTRDPHRQLRELFFPLEAMPEDDWPTSATRWRNLESIAKRLCAMSAVPWNGLSANEVETLVEFVPCWPEPLEGCLLHALVQWTHHRGHCVIEIGSFRGRSASMLALGLRGADSDSPLISIDPHSEEPHNLAHVRLALTQLGEEKRLVQIAHTSDRAWRVLRPGSASMIFVDGDHAYHQVVSDFTHYRDLLAPGGCMVFHDYGYGNHNGRPEVQPDVRRAVDEHVIPNAGFKLLLLAHTLLALEKLPG